MTRPDVEGLLSLFGREPVTTIPVVVDLCRYILAREAALAETPENVVRLQKAIIDQDVFSRLMSALDQWDARDPTGLTRVQDAALAIAEDTARAVLRALREGI